MTNVESLLATALVAQLDAPAAPPFRADAAVFELAPTRVERRTGRAPRWSVIASAAAVAASVVALAALAMQGTAATPTVTPVSVGSVTGSPVLSAKALAPSPYGLKPGQFLKVSSGDASDGLTVWIPADPNGNWSYSQRWSPDNDPSDFDAETRPCARFVENNGTDYPGTHTEDPNSVPDCQHGSFLQYRPQFAESLPNDPARIRAMMVEQSFPKSTDDVFMTGDGLIASGWAPNSVAKKVEAALVGLPGVIVRTHQHDGYGQVGTVIAVKNMKDTPDALESEVGLMFDPTTGRVLDNFDELSGHDTYGPYVYQVVDSAPTFK